LTRPVIFLICMLLVITAPTLCHGGWKGKRSKMGVNSLIGSNPRSNLVKSYVKIEGSFVRPSRQNNPNKIELDKFGAKQANS
jgi:hypothetical protein